MREVKFRAWDIENKIMLYPADGILPEDSGTQFWNGQDWQKKFELMQYTGIKDKNGKDVYEADVFHLPHINGFFLVEWGTYEWCDRGFIGFDLNAKDSSEIEVIDNIYDNPALLKKVGK